MKLTDILLEIFKNQYPWKWAYSHDEDVEVEATFTVADGSVIEIKFLDLIGDDDDDMEGGSYEFIFLRSSAPYQYSDAITGQKDAFKIFSTVYGILKQFIQRDNPSTVMFSAKEPSRHKLYSKLLPKMAQELGMVASQDGDDFQLDRKYIGNQK